MKLILGSSSKWRKKLLEEAGYVFDVASPDVDEQGIKTDDPYERPLILARAKADALIEKIKEPALVITSDTIIVAEGKLYEKPKDLDEARKFLEEFSAGLAPEGVTALVVANTATGERFEAVDKAQVFFKPFPKQMIEDFLREAEPLTLAGGFGMGHPIMKPYVDRVEGNRETIIGMPLKLLRKLLREAGHGG